MSGLDDAAAGRPGIIHDLGYRPYDGPRGGEGSIAWALYVTGVRNAFGLGRSGRSKVLPFLLLGINLLPAVIVVGVLVMIHLEEVPISYVRYASMTSMLTSIFVASQAPVLFSHDQRHGSLALYLARPLRAATYAVVRWASLWTALFAYLALPILVLYVGSLLAELDLGEQSRDAGRALLAVGLFAAVLAGVGGVLSSWSIRRGFAVVATIMVLLIGNGVVSIVQGIASAQNHERVGEIAGLLSPLTLYNGCTAAFDSTSPALTPPTGGVMISAYYAVSVAVVLGCLGLLVLRFRKVAAR